MAGMFTHTRWRFDPVPSASFCSAQVARQVLSPTGSYVVAGSNVPAIRDEPHRSPRNMVCAELVPDSTGAKAQLYEAVGRSTSAAAVKKQCGKADLRHLDGRRIEKLSPFQIARLKIRR